MKSSRGLRFSDWVWLAPHALGVMMFLFCQGLAALIPTLKLEWFCRPAAKIASFFLGAPSVASSDGFVITNRFLEVRVVEACSGFDFFSLLFAVFVGLSFYYGVRSPRVVFCLLPLSYAIALAANVARIVCAAFARISSAYLPVVLSAETVHHAVGACVFTSILLVCCHFTRLFYESYFSRARAT